MIKTLATATQLREYTDGVAERAACHAPDVDEVWPSILGYVVVRADNPMAFMARMNRAGDGFANQAWAEINGKRITFTYRRQPSCRVAMCWGHTVLAEFDNATTQHELKVAFDAI